MPPRPAASPADVQRHCYGLFVRYSQILVAVVVASTLIFWPLDAWVFQASPGVRYAATLWRSVESVLCIGYLLLARLPPLREHLRWLHQIWLAGSGLVVGYSAGLMGGPELPWFHLMYVMPFAPASLPLPLPERVKSTLALVLGVLCGYLVPFSAHRASAYLPLSLCFFAFVTLLSLYYGHMLYLLIRTNYLQATELERHGDELQSQVAARTVELRTLLAYVETSREEERALISREIHDQLGHELLALRYAVDHTRQRYQRTPLVIDANLEELSDMVQQTVEETGRLVADLRPQILDRLGLLASAEWLVRRASERAGVACSLQTSGEIDAFSPEVRLAAFRILQESITNVIRHAQAKQVEVRIEQSHPNELTLLVQDDGIGISEDGRRGMGLLGMRERARMLGGDLQIRRRSPAGTEVRCVLKSRAEVLA